MWDGAIRSYHLVAADGRTRLSNPPLALDLHYLLTAYGSRTGKRRRCWDSALLMLHEYPVLTRNDISRCYFRPPMPINPIRSP